MATEVATRAVVSEASGRGQQRRPWAWRRRGEGGCDEDGRRLDGSGGEGGDDGGGGDDRGGGDGGNDEGDGLGGGGEGDCLEARGEGGGGSEAAMRAMGSKKRRGASAHEIHLACAC